MSAFRVLFLDDMEVRHDIFREETQGFSFYTEHVYTAEEAISCLRFKPKWDCVWLDHDLKQEHYTYYEQDPYPEGTGLEVAKFIANELPPLWRPKLIVLHTASPRGYKNMAETLSQVHGVHRVDVMDARRFCERFCST